MLAETVLPTMATVSTDPKVWSQITHPHLTDMCNEQLLVTAPEFLESQRSPPNDGLFPPLSVFPGEMGACVLAEMKTPMLAEV